MCKYIHTSIILTFTLLFGTASLVSATNNDVPSRKFRTMPETADRPIRFAAGGDVRHQVNWMDQTNRRAMAYEPDFVLWGGDLAYADGREDRAYRWYEFTEYYTALSRPRLSIRTQTEC